MITSSEATFRALLASAIADDGERERLASELARASEVEVEREKSQLAASLHQEIRAPQRAIALEALSSIRCTRRPGPQRRSRRAMARSERVAAMSSMRRSSRS